MTTTKITPIRKVKEGSRGTYYESKVACAKLSIFIVDDGHGPVRVTVENKGGGCEANLTAISRLVTLLLECNIKEDTIIEQLDKVFCPACRTQAVKGENVSMSCSKAIAGALKKHLYNGSEEKKA